ncbi:MAG: hypothetical protein DRP57_08665, partial [Spirochaetes bacterium]
MVRIYSLLVVVLLLVGNLLAQNAQEIVAKADAVVNAPKDQKATMKMVLIDKNGNKKERKAEFLQKGNEKRIMRFIAPADQKALFYRCLGRG